MTHPPQHPPRTALVLGGGGSAGNAWLIGVIAGLAEAGLDVTDADLVIGTSAGSTAAAQLSGAAPARLLADILAAPPLPSRPSPSSSPSPGSAGAAGIHRRPAGARPAVDHVERNRAIIADSADAADLRRRYGVAALEAAAAGDGSARDRWRTIVAARLPDQQWPERRVLITAVDADSGEPVVFDRDSGVDLVDAVAASCSSGSAYGIGERRYIDGGYRSNADNADLAAGYARVLVLSPFGGRSLTPVEWGLHLSTQVDHLRAHGSRVETIFPDADAQAAFGDNAMDPSTRAPAARAGFEQGRALAASLGEFWR